MAGSRVKVTSSAAIAEGALFSAKVDNRKILIARLEGRLYGVIDRCPHMGMSMAKGCIADGVLTCPWHNSRFDFRTGRNLDWVSAVMGVAMPSWTHKAISMGKAPAPLKTLAVEEVADDVFVTF